MCVRPQIGWTCSWPATFRRTLCGVTVARTLAELGGIAPARDLAARGIGPGLIRTSWQAGEISRIRKGWYALRTLSSAVLRASRVGGVVSCVSAAREHGLWTPAGESLHVAVPATASRLRAPHDHRTRLSDSGALDVRIHWSADARAPYELVEPLDRALSRITDCCGDETAFVVLESALSKRRVTPDVAARLSGRSAVLAFADDRSDSGLESLLKLELLRNRIDFRQQVGVVGCGIADFLIGDRLVVETDGRSFHDPLSDRRRDARFSIAGYRTLRFLTAQVLHERGEVIASIRAAIARGDHR